VLSLYYGVVIKYIMLSERKMDVQENIVLWK